MRIIKEADERKNEILDAAGELFSKKGFDGTSTNDILKKVGIARGTLYYHFNSKEDILDALIDRVKTHILGTAQKIATDKSLPVNERILRVIMALTINNGNTQELIEQMHKPQNALMHQKTQKAMLMGVTPILTKIIREGISQGLFNTPFPYECMEMLMIYANTVFDDDDTIELTGEQRQQRLQAFIFNVERLLDAKSGSLTPIVMKMFCGGN